MIVRQTHHKLILGSLVLIGLFSFNIADAIGLEGPIVPCGTSEDPEDCTLCHLWELASNIINFVSFNLAIPIAAFLFIIAGVLFLISGGNEERVKLARSIFTNVVIGLVIIFASWLLVDTFVKTLVSQSFETTKDKKIYYSWNDFPKCE